jgi:hypothetical protein
MKMSSKYWGGLAICVALLSAVVPAFAHHSIASEYDFNKPVDLTGTLVQMDWVNPHSVMHLQVANSDGSKTVWLFQTQGTGNPLRRSPSQGGLELGKTYAVQGFAAKNGKPQAFLKSVKMPDGRLVTLWFGDPNGGGGNPGGSN